VMNTLNSLPNCIVSANTTKTLKTSFDKLDNQDTGHL